VSNISASRIDIGASAMNRMVWLDPLVNHLKQSSFLNGHGSDEYPDLAGENIYVVANYNEFMEINQRLFGVIISPMEGEPRDVQECGTEFTFRFMVGAMANDVSNTLQNFTENIQNDFTDLQGAYPYAATFEHQIRLAILEFNEILKTQRGWQYQPFECVSLEREFVHNGLIVMRTIYQTKFNF
jgi:hypothetical protein